MKRENKILSLLLAAALAVSVAGCASSGEPQTSATPGGEPVSSLEDMYESFLAAVDPDYAYDYEKVIPLFGENHKLVEINDHSFVSRKQNIENCKKIALCCKKHGVPIVVDSDAHFEVHVGEFGHALEMLSEIDFPEELILNASAERLNDYLRKYTGIFERRKS